MKALKSTEIRKLRQALEMTQDEFGREFPINGRTVQRWEANEMVPSPMARKRMADLQKQLSEQTPEPKRLTMRPISDTRALPRRRFSPGVTPSMHATHGSDNGDSDAQETDS